jgi:hypothetical protein
MILMVVCLMAVMLSAAPALARHGADDPAGHTMLEKATITTIMELTIANQR